MVGRLGSYGNGWDLLEWEWKEKKGQHLEHKGNVKSQKRRLRGHGMGSVRLPPISEKNICGHRRVQETQCQKAWVLLICQTLTCSVVLGICSLYNQVLRTQTFKISVSNMGFINLCLFLYRKKSHLMWWPISLHSATHSTLTSVSQFGQKQVLYKYNKKIFLITKWITLMPIM